jgi:hypothetical protein
LKRLHVADLDGRSRGAVVCLVLFQLIFYNPIVQHIEDHIREIERCNQRGGRMLTVVDLIRAGTLDGWSSAYLLAAISRRHSFLVGARPGGAGKTTVMGALLNFVPPDVALVSADDIARIDATNAQQCVICHEMGPGTYYGYLWGTGLRRYFSLTDHGQMLATNLHADDPTQTQAQVCAQNGVLETQYRQVHLLVFLRVTHEWSNHRQVFQIWESNGDHAHQLVYDRDHPNTLSSRLVTESSVEHGQRLLKKLLEAKHYLMPDVRGFLVDHWDQL